MLLKKIFYTFLLISPLLFISSCEEEEETQSGYNCVSNTCSAVFESPQYLTLEDCQSACEAPSGYDCVSNTCSAVFDNPQYLTLEDCQSTCEEEPPAGYVCVSNNCIPVFENPLYTSLSECQTACSENIGCIDESACNYNETASVDDGSCEYAEQGYDCDGNMTAEIGDIIQGGMLFYIDETGQHGLVVAMEDLGKYEWGCKGVVAISELGDGIQNTLNIINQECETEDGDITAAQATYDAIINNYDDWYLPNHSELHMIYSNVGVGSPGGNISGALYTRYWSSKEKDEGRAYVFNMGDYNNISYHFTKSSKYRVIPIRSF